MEDFAKWITVCEKALNWTDGEFMEIYNRNRGKALDQGLESDPFASGVIELMKRNNEWIGNASQLLAASVPLIWNSITTNGLHGVKHTRLADGKL